jgi:hypothetical protein
MAEEMAIGTSNRKPCCSCVWRDPDNTLQKVLLIRIALTSGVYTGSKTSQSSANPLTSASSTLHPSRPIDALQNALGYAHPKVS